jgi:hypothetical protein
VLGFGRGLGGFMCDLILMVGLLIWAFAHADFSIARAGFVLHCATCFA